MEPGQYSETWKRFLWIYSIIYNTENELGGLKVTLGDTPARFVIQILLLLWG